MVHQKDLAAIGDHTIGLWEELRNHGRDAGSSSLTAATDLKTQGCKLGGGVARVQESWEEQLTSLVDACAHISNHMDFTKKAHQGDEYYILGQVSSIATLDKGFGEKPEN